MLGVRWGTVIEELSGLNRRGIRGLPSLPARAAWGRSQACSQAQGFGVAVDGEGLTGDTGAAIGTKEEYGCGDIVGSN